MNLYLIGLFRKKGLPKIIRLIRKKNQIKLLEMKNEPLKFNIILYIAREKISELEDNMNKVYRMQCEKIKKWQIKEELRDIKT